MLWNTKVEVRERGACRAGVEEEEEERVASVAWVEGGRICGFGSRAVDGMVIVSKEAAMAPNGSRRSEKIYIGDTEKRSRRVKIPV